MDRESIAQDLLSLSGPERRISCTEARKLAADRGVDTLVIGQLCDELGIHIYACELGCF